MTKSYTSLTLEERINYFHSLGKRVLAHRYRYYILDAPETSDFEYDNLEKYYEAVATDLNLDSVVKNLVGYGITEICQEVAQLVRTEQDDYSLWLKEMMIVWQAIGLPRYLKNKDNIEVE